LRVLSTFCILICSISIDAGAAPDFSGTWSDPPPRAEDAFCHIGCLIEARDFLTSLLDDPANDEKSYAELKTQAQRFQIAELLPGYMTSEALRERMANRDPRPLSSVCIPWGLVRTSMAPHAMQLTRHEDYITLYYSEWTVLRHVYMDGRNPPADLKPSKYGYSVGHFDGDALIVETTGIIADNFAAGGFPHSDQVTVTERFVRVDEDRLEVEVVLTDPLMYKQPLRMARAWAWAPGEEIYPYDNCVIPE
jgi:hypothetical protein